MKGSYLKASKLLNWRPVYNIKTLIREMIDHENKTINDKKLVIYVAGHRGLIDLQY